MTRLALLSFTVSLLAAACRDSKEDDGADDTGIVGDDTGPIVYDEGCITVDGVEPGYAWINDAIANADEGSTITLCASEAHEEAVLVDKGVTILGPGVDDFLLVAPTNQAGVTITADGASLSGIRVSTTRSAIDIEDAANVTISEVAVAEAGTWALKATDATDLVIESATLTANSYGALQVDGGSVTVSGSTFTDNLGYGVYGSGSGSVTVEGCTITGTLYTDEDALADGVGIYMSDGASVTTSGNVISDSYLVNIYGDEGDLYLSGDEVSGSLYGIVAILGDLVADDLVVTDAYVQGVFAVSTTSVALDGIEVSGTPKTTAEVGDDTWGSKSAGFPGTGMYLVSDETTVSNTTVTGYNHCGILLAPYDSGTATLDTVTISDVGRKGIYVLDADLDATDVTISGVHEVEDYGAELCYTVDLYGGVVGELNNMSWTGGSVTDVEGYGISAVQGSLDITGSTIARNECAGVMSFYGSLVATDNTFTEGGVGDLGASIIDYYGSASVISDNLFSGNQQSGTYVQEYDYWDDYGYRYSYTYQDAPIAVDIAAYVDSSVVVSGNTFENGDNGLSIIGSSVELSDNSWTSYRGTPISAQIYDDTRPAIEITNGAIEDFSNYALYCYGADIDVDDLTISDGGTYSYSYDYLYEDTSGNTSSFTSTSTTTGSAIYGNGCNLVADGMEIQDVEGYVLYAYSYSYSGSYEFSDFVAENVGTGSASYYSAVYAYGYYQNTDIIFYNASITNAETNNAIHLEPYSYSTSYDHTISFEANGLEIDGAESHGIYMMSDRVSATVSDSSITGAASYGIYASGSDLVVEDTTVTGNGSAGIYLATTTGSVTGTTSTGNGTWGMECSAATIDDCSGNDLSGNASGEQSGCDESCGL